MSTDSPKLMNRDAWLSALGFPYSPFDHPAADRPLDRHLGEYAISFPFFDDLRAYGSSIIFAREGHGKSAYRIELARTLKTRTLKDTKPRPDLVSHCTDFAGVVEDPSPQRHCDAILRLSLRTLLVIFGEELVEKAKTMPSPARRDLEWLVSEYADRSQSTQKLDSSEKEELAELKKRLQKLKLRKAREGYATPPEVLNEIDDLTVEIASRELSVNTVPGNGSPSSVTVPQKLERLNAVVDALGFDALFVLVELDAPPDGPWTLETQAEVIRSLVAYRGFQNYLHLKLFLPYELLPALKRGRARPLERDWEIKRLEWSTEDIDNILRTRLAVAGYHSFNDLVEGTESPSKIHDRIVELAGGSPRELVSLCRFIFSQHVKRPTSRVYFTEQEIEASLAAYRELQQEGL